MSPDPVNRLEKAMRLYHEKMEKKLRRTWASRQGRALHSPVAETTDAHRPEEIEPITGQFDDEDLDHNVFDPLEMPMTTPVQDEGQAPTALLEPQTATSSQGVENAPTSQAKQSYPTFTSPRYWQEEIAGWEEPAYPPGMPELLSRTPGTTPKTTPGTTPKTTLGTTPKTTHGTTPKTTSKPSPKTTPKVTPQTSPNQSSPCKSLLRGHARGTVNSPSGLGRGMPLPP